MADIFDLTIIGGGPAGLYAAYYAGFRTLKVKIVDSLGELGGQVTALYPEKQIFDVAGFPKILGKDLVNNLVEQGLQYKPTVCLNEKITMLKANPDKTFQLTSDKGTHTTRAVLITLGVGAFNPKRIPAAGADTFEGKGLAYFVPDISRYDKKNVVIVGGGDSAVDWALNLLPRASSITLVHRRDGFRAHEESVRLLKASPVNLKLFYEVKEIKGNDHIESVSLFNNKTQAIETIPADEVLGCLGFEASVGPLATWGLTLHGNDILVTTKMETNLPGVYAAGDVAAYTGKVKLIACGFGEAAIAVNNAVAYLNPGASVFQDIPVVNPNSPSSMFSAASDFLQKNLPVGSKMLVAISGGPDSVALAHFLRGQPYSLVLGHVDHQLRKGSARDARFVESLAREWDLPCSVKAVRVTTFRRQEGLGIEEAARELRYRALAQMAATHRCVAIATAHTANDQAETVLMNFLRGAGPAGLAGIPWMRTLNAKKKLQILRPFLMATRDEVMRYLKRQGLPFRQDPTNRSPRFTRNRIRHSTLPSLEKLFPGFAGRLVQAADIYREEEEFWRHFIADHLHQTVREHGRRLTVVLPRLLRYHKALNRRILRHILPGLSFQDIEQVLTLARSPEQTPWLKFGRRRVKREKNTLVVVR